MLSRSSKLIENIFSMVSLRALEYILSFILVPYLLIVLGPEKMGAIVFAQSIMTYLVLVSAYGFNLTAPRAIARAERCEYSHLFSLYMYGSVLLGGISTIILLFGGIIYRQMGYTPDVPLYVVTYTAVIGNIIFPIWFFQGIQEMRYITILNLIGRFLCILGIFTFVKGPDDYILAALFQSCTPCIAGIISLVILTRRFDSLWSLPTFSDLLTIYKQGWLRCISTMTINR